MSKQNEQKSIQIPLPNLRPRQEKTVLGLGAELKANFCIINNGIASLSRGFGDLKNPDCYNSYKKAVINELKKKKLNPKIIVSDLNPQFLNTKFATELQKELFTKSTVSGVQHHYAHIAGAMALLNLQKKRAIGIACDGTGWGDDGRIWGFEFLLANLRGYKRVGHLDYIQLPGADRAVTEPIRVALGLLFKTYGDNIYKLPIEWLKKSHYKIDILLKMLKSNINSPLASSAGRVFDGVAALTGICCLAKFEAEPAIRLEQEAAKVINKETRQYPYKIKKCTDKFVIDIDLMTRAIVKDISKKIPKKNIAARFHNTFSHIIIAMCKKIKKEYSVADVVLGGGVFFNKIITRQVQAGLEKNGFIVHRPYDFVLGDAGLSLGQAVIAYVSGSSRKN